jgi:PAS domain S-box-containing protein
MPVCLSPVWLAWHSPWRKLSCLSSCISMVGGSEKMEVDYSVDHLDASTTLAALLDEFSAVTDYHTLRDNLPRRLAGLLRCRCVLFYQRLGETLQFASGSFADQPGWSAALLAVAHINPIELNGDVPEAHAWRAHKAILVASAGREHAQICTPLIYRQRAIGILTAIRGAAPAGLADTEKHEELCWRPEEVGLVAVAANMVAMLLENTRLLERDRERIHELALLNSITSQLNCSLREAARVHRAVIQRAREIALPDLCDVLPPDAGTHVSSGLSAWVPPPLHEMLLQHWQSTLPAAPLFLERGSTRQANEYMEHLDTRIKTFFALPLLGRRGETARPGLQFVSPLPRASDEPGVHMHGILVGAYHKSWKLRREEQVLLQILTNQASAVLENITLMNDVIEARNEARRLLRRVLDDQRFKELILESIPSGLITIDLQGQITTFNRAAETVLGYHPREIIGQPVRKVLDLCSLEKGLRSGQLQHETLLTSGRQGQEIALEVTLVPLRDPRGQQVGALATFADITSIYRLEEEKRRLDRLASLGEMSANVAHEVRNPLAAIKTSMQMLRDELEDNSEFQANEGAQEEIAVVLKEVERLDGIVRDLLLFARPRQLHRVEHDLGELCARVLRFLRPQCEEQGVRVRLVQQDVPPVRIDVAQMEQVLLNIFSNALQAMPDGGLLSVSFQILSTPADAASADERGPEFLPESSPGVHEIPGESESTGLIKQAEAFIALSAAWEEQETPGESGRGDVPGRNQQAWLELIVSDTGVGIAQDALERIFQPFYTTKAHGIGLGLPITRRLVEDHHGSLFVESQLGYGTTVSVRLPLGQEALTILRKRVEGENTHCEPDDPDCR